MPSVSLQPIENAFISQHFLKDPSLRKQSALLLEVSLSPLLMTLDSNEGVFALVLVGLQVPEHQSLVIVVAKRAVQLPLLQEVPESFQVDLFPLREGQRR